MASIYLFWNEDDLARNIYEAFKGVRTQLRKPEKVEEVQAVVAEAIFLANIQGKDVSIVTEKYEVYRALWDAFSNAKVPQAAAQLEYAFKPEEGAIAA